MSGDPRYPWALRTERWPDDEPLVGPETRARRFSAPRSLWSDGPWDDEPDEIHWRHAPSGYPLLMWRNFSGAWCGYVGVPAGHPLHGLGYDNADLCASLPAHGGLTFAGQFDPRLPSPRRDPAEAGHWWLGFDCSHGFDVMPALEALSTAISPDLAAARARLKRQAGRAGFWTERYMNVTRVRLEVEELAERVFEAARLSTSVEETLARLGAGARENNENLTERDAPDESTTPRTD
jgi:hypothetical protein